MKSQRIQIACTSDAAYGPHCAAMLHSLLGRHAPGEVCVHFPHGPDMPRRLKRRFDALVKRCGGELLFHEVPDAAVAGLPTLTRIPVLMWYRIYLPELLVEHDRVLYLDADTLVLDRLDGLWATSLEGRYVAAVTNVLEPARRSLPGALGLNRVTDYFNSGVLLMNLAKLREDGCVERIRREGLARGSKLEFPDQDALNIVMGSHRVHLHPRWNCMNSLSFFADAPDFFPPGQVAEALANPAIVHFEGPPVVKPWHLLNDNPHRDHYYAHLRGSRWPVTLPEGVTWRNLAKRFLPDAVKVPLRKIRKGLRARPS